MLSQTGTSRTRRFSMILCAPLAALVLSACTAQSQLAQSLAPAPYLALNTAGGPTSLVHESGYFTAENGCVVFRTAQGSVTVTPVFPASSTRLVRDDANWLGMYMDQAPVAFGKMYRLTGAPVTRTADMTLTANAPTGCPTSYFAVQTVGQALAEDDGATVCRAVILCNWYRVN